MKIEFRPARSQDLPVLRRLMQLYLYDFAAIDDWSIGDDGLYGNAQVIEGFWTDPRRTLRRAAAARRSRRHAALRHTVPLTSGPVPVSCPPRRRRLRWLDFGRGSESGRPRGHPHRRFSGTGGAESSAQRDRGRRAERRGRGDAARVYGVAGGGGGRGGAVVAGRRGARRSASSRSGVARRISLVILAASVAVPTTRGVIRSSSSVFSMSRSVNLKR